MPIMSQRCATKNAEFLRIAMNHTAFIVRMGSELMIYGKVR
jgi:hypothetical protein